MGDRMKSESVTGWPRITQRKFQNCVKNNLGCCSFAEQSIDEAQDHATQWLWTYNIDRPNMGIGGITPAQKLKIAA